VGSGSKGVLLAIITTGCQVHKHINLRSQKHKIFAKMTFQNSSTDTASAAGIPTADAVVFAVPIEDNTDVEKGGAASHVVQPQAAPVMYLTPPPPGARQPAQAPPRSSGCNSR